MKPFISSIALILLLTSGGGFADDSSPVTWITKSLGVIPESGSKSRLAGELHALLDKSPAAEVGVVMATVPRPDSMKTSYFKIVYDRKREILLLLIRTNHSEGSFFHMRVYDRNTTMDEFKKRLPVRGYKGYPRSSQSTKISDHKLPLNYPHAPEITAWPRIGKGLVKPAAPKQDRK